MGDGREKAKGKRGSPPSQPGGQKAREKEKSDGPSAGKSGQRQAGNPAGPTEGILTAAWRRCQPPRVVQILGDPLGRRRHKHGEHSWGDSQPRGKPALQLAVYVLRAPDHGCGVHVEAAAGLLGRNPCCTCLGNVQPTEPALLRCGVGWANDDFSGLSVLYAAGQARAWANDHCKWREQEREEALQRRQLLQPLALPVALLPKSSASLMPATRSRRERRGMAHTSSSPSSRRAWGEKAMCVLRAQGEAGSV